MPASSNTGMTRERLKTIIESVSPISSARVKLGLHDLAQTTEFFNDIASSGPFVVVRPAVIDKIPLGSNNIQEFSVDVRVWFGFASDADYDGTAYEDLIEDLTQGLRDVSAYTSGASIPLEMSMTRDEEINLKPRVILTTYAIQFMGPI